MDKKTKILLLVNILVVAFAVLIIAGSFNSDDKRLIGYEFLDNNTVVHIWNNATISDYFFEKEAGIQLTNNYEEYWSRNIFCIGYYDGDTWNKIKCADELSNFNKDIQTDNLTHVTATLWKDFTYEIYNFRLGVQYYLGLNNKTLSVTIYGKNMGIDIPFDLGFAWKVTDVNIPPFNVSDEITINVTVYPLNETYDLLFKDMDIAGFKILDDCKKLRIDWNENLSYAVKMHGDGNQENFYIALLINAGYFSSGQEKTTTFQWIDAGTCEGEVDCGDIDIEGDCNDCGCVWELGTCFPEASCEGTEYSCEDCPGCTWIPAGPENIWVNEAGTWRDVEEVWVNEAGTWRDVETMYVNVAGSWDDIFTS